MKINWDLLPGLITQAAVAVVQCSPAGSLPRTPDSMSSFVSDVVSNPQRPQRNSFSSDGVRVLPHWGLHFHLNGQQLHLIGLHLHLIGPYLHFKRSPTPFYLSPACPLGASACAPARHAAIAGSAPHHQRTADVAGGRISHLDEFSERPNRIRTIGIP